MAYKDYFNDAKDKMKELIEADTDIMDIVRKVYTADVIKIPKNFYPAICLEADSEEPSVGTSKQVKIEMNMNVWFYIPITLERINEEKAERELLKIGASLNKFFSTYETVAGLWVKSDWDSIEYGFKETNRLLRTGVIRWKGQSRFTGGW